MQGSPRRKRRAIQAMPRPPGSTCTKRYYRMAVYSSEQAAEDTGNAASGARSEGRRSRHPASPKRAPSSTRRFCTSARTGSTLPARRIRRSRSTGTRSTRSCARRRTRSTTEGEALLASFGLMDDAGGSVYTILTNADMPWPTVKLSDGRGGEARRVRLHQVSRAAEPRRPQEGDGRLLRHVQDVRAHARRRLLFAAEGGHRLREGAQVSGLDHALARRATTCRSRCSTR